MQLLRLRVRRPHGGPLAYVFLRGFPGRRQNNDNKINYGDVDGGGLGPANGGVDDDEYEGEEFNWKCVFSWSAFGVQRETPRLPEKAFPLLKRLVKRPTRDWRGERFLPKEGLEKLVTDMHDFNLQDQNRRQRPLHYAHQCHSTDHAVRVRPACDQKKCRPSYPHARQETIQTTDHPLVHPPTI